jgi:phage-related tail protein
MRNQSLLEDDDEMYEEYDAQLRETEKNLNKASAKLAETMRQWEAENELK